MLKLLAAGGAIAIAGILLLTLKKEPAPMRDRLVLPLSSMPASIVPTSMGQVDAWRIGKLLTDGLFSMDDSLEVKHVVAAKAKFNNTKTIIDISLKNMKFSDGSDLTVEDTIETIKRCTRHADKLGTESFRKIKGYERFISGKTSELEGVTRLSNTALRVELTDPSGLLFSDLSDNGCFIAKAGPSGEVDFLKGAVGLGPYRIFEVTESAIVLERNPYFTYQHAGPRFLEFRQATHLGQLREMSKTFDIIVSEHPNGGPQEGFSEAAYSRLGAMQLILNCKRGPLSSPAVRKALYLAFNGKPFADQLGWQISEFQEGIIPFGLGGFRKRTSFKNLPEAEALLASQGFSDSKPLEITIVISKGSGTEVEAEIWSKQAFPTKFIKIKAASLPLNEFYPQVLKFEFDAIRVSKYPGSDEAHRMLGAFLSDSPFNFGGFKSATCDQRLRETFKETDYNKRIEKYIEADKCLMEEFPILPLTAHLKGMAYIRKPWSFIRKNRFALRPFYVGDWMIEE